MPASPDVPVGALFLFLRIVKILNLYILYIKKQYVTAN